jgi:hypothetical protein
MRVALAMLMALHGIAHTAGFAESWRLAPGGGVPYKTTVLGGRVDLGDTGIRTIGLLWLAVATAFLCASIATVLNASWWRPAAAASAMASLGLTFLELPQARLGTLINVVILTSLLLL